MSDIMSHHEVQKIDDVDELLDVRAKHLGIVSEIEMQLAADDTLPSSNEGWRQSATRAIWAAQRVARLASARLLRLAPETLAGEGRVPAGDEIRIECQFVNAAREMLPPQMFTSVMTAATSGAVTTHWKMDDFLRSPPSPPPFPFPRD